MPDAPPKPRVVVVEDEEELADLYSEWLTADYDVSTVYGGEQALAVIDETVDVVLLDRRMPDVSGAAVLDEIRDHGYECRVAMVTAVEPDLDIIELRFDDYVTKPVTKSELLDTVDGLLTLSKYDRQLQEYYSLASTKVVLNDRMDQAALADSEEYERLTTRIDELEEELASTLAELQPGEGTDRDHSPWSVLDSPAGNGDTTPTDGNESE